MILGALSAVYPRKQRLLNWVSQSKLSAYDPKIITGFAAIHEATGTSGMHAAKCVDLLRWLNRTRPRHIVELGSGRTTLALAAYASKTKARMTVFEQDQGWADLLRPLASAIYPDLELLVVPLVARPLGASFSLAVPSNCDFLYVDAPYVPSTGEFATASGRPAYYDAADLLEAGGRPTAIVVDGRVDTVDLIRAASQSYQFHPSFDWASANHDTAAAMRLPRHTVFLSR